MRSWSNALERLHHSSAFYLLLSSSRLVSPPAYLPAAGLLVAGPLLRACAAAARGVGGYPPPTPADWAYATLVAAAIYGACVAMMHGLLACAQLAAPTALPAWWMLQWLLVRTARQLPARLLGDNRQLRDGPWVALRTVVQLVTCIWLLRTAVACFALALPAALVLSPICLAAQPCRPEESRFGRVTRWAFLIAASPPVALACAAALFGCPLQHVLAQLRLHAVAWDTLLLPLLFSCLLPCFLLAALLESPGH